MAQGAEINVGHVLDGKYLIEAVLGRGGMGVVYRARHLELGASRAIKVMHRELAENEEFLRRFRYEAQLAEELRHPNLVTLYDLSPLPDGSLYIVWEYVEGETLAAELSRGVVYTPPDVAQLVSQVADGLAAAHRRSILHRDISPDNVMITRDAGGRRRAKVLDFGMAKLVGSVTQPSLRYTTTGVFLGKIGYSSPEQVGLLEEQAQLDERADIFSLAVVAYRMLTGKLPFRTSSVQAFLFDLTTAPEGQVRAKLEAALPGPWRKPMSRALRRDRSARTPSMEELKADFEAAARETPFRAGIDAPPSDGAEDVVAKGEGRRKWPGATWGVALLVLLVAATALLRWRGPKPSTPTERPTEASLAPEVEKERASLRDRVPPEATHSRERAGATEPVPVDSSAATPSAPPLPPPTGRLVVASTTAAQLLVDGSLRGSTPLTLDLEPGRHEVTFKTAEGFHSEQTVVVIGGESVTLSPRLNAFGSLSVTSDVWAEVKVDDRALEQTPVLIRRLPAGRHHLRVSKSGYREQVLEVVIKEGETTTVRLKLEANP